MTWKEKIRSSRTRTATTLFYTKISRVSWIRAITDTGEEKRTGEVPTLRKTLHGCHSGGGPDHARVLIHTHP